MIDPFHKVEREFLRLKTKLAVGRISSEEFNAAVEQLTVRDAQGRVWKINPETGNWKVRNEPGTGSTTVPERPHVVFSTPRKSHRKRNFLIGATVVVALVALAVVSLALFSTRPITQASLNPTATVSPASISIAATGPTATLTPTDSPTSTPAPTDTATPSPIPTATPVPATATPLAPKDMIRYLNPKKYPIEFTLAAASGDYETDELRVYQARPIDWPNQQVQMGQVSPAPSREIVDPVSGNHIYYWQLAGQPPKGGSITLTLQFLVTAYETLTYIDPSVILPYNTADPQYALYTRPERYIESDDPQIVQLANQLAGSETNPYRLARKFYDYVIDHAQYQPTGRGLAGAKALLTDGTGEDGDYTALFVALARAKGIPARPIVGYWARTGLDQTHVWGEFYLEPIGWIPVDPTVGQMQPLNRNYYFGKMDNERVILHKNYNLPLDPPLPNGDTLPLLQAPAWWVSGKGDVSTLRVNRASWSLTSAAP